MTLGVNCGELSLWGLCSAGFTLPGSAGPGAGLAGAFLLVTEAHRGVGAVSLPIQERSHPRDALQPRCDVYIGLTLCGSSAVSGGVTA